MNIYVYVFYHCISFVYMSYVHTNCMIIYRIDKCVDIIIFNFIFITSIYMSMVFICIYIYYHYVLIVHVSVGSMVEYHCYSIHHNKPTRQQTIVPQKKKIKRKDLSDFCDMSQNAAADVSTSVIYGAIIFQFKFCGARIAPQTYLH